MAGIAGLTIDELGTQLTLQYYDCRSVLRNLCRKGLAVCTRHDQGKTEIRRFVFYAISLSMLSSSLSSVASFFVATVVLLCYKAPSSHLKLPSV